MAEKSSDQGGADVRPTGDAAKKHEGPKLSSPHEHAVAIGSFKQRVARAGAVVASVGGRTPDLGEYSWQHQAAAALHGWGGPGLTEGHEHHEGKPIELTADDYKRALLAASAPVTRALVDFSKGDLKGKKGEVIDSHKAAEFGIPVHTDYEPHSPALSKHAAHAKKTEADRKAAEAEKA